MSHARKKCRGFAHEPKPAPSPRGLGFHRLGVCKKRVGLLESAEHFVPVAGLFQEGLRVPLTPRHTEKVAAVDVNRASQTRDWVRHRMDDVVSQLYRVFS